MNLAIVIIGSALAALAIIGLVAFIGMGEFTELDRKIPTQRNDDAEEDGEVR